MKIFKVLIFLLLACSQALAQNASIYNSLSAQNITFTNQYAGATTNRTSNKLTSLKQYAGLLFYKDFTDDQTTLDADFSMGSPTVTLTRPSSSSNPATAIDSSGIINLITTSDLPRFPKKYYDTTGVHSYSKSGVFVEQASTNLMTRTDGTSSGSGLWSSWADNSSVSGSITRTNPTIADLTSISGATSQRLQYVSASDSNKGLGLKSPLTSTGSVVNGDVMSVSVYIRSQTGNSGVSSIAFTFRTRDSSSALLSTYSSGDISSSVSTDWRRFYFTNTVTDATASKVDFTISVFGVDTGDSVDIEFAGVQVEKNGYPTSWIPTKTVALTRNAEALSFVSAGNRNADTETLFIGFMPTGLGFSDSSVRYVTSTDTKNRLMLKTSLTSLRFRPNSTDSSVCNVDSTTSPAINTNYITTARSQHTSPYATIFFNGVSETTDAGHDYTTPVWGTNSYLGSLVGTSSFLNGLITSVTVYSDPKTDAAVSTIYNIIN